MRSARPVFRIYTRSSVLILLLLLCKKFFFIPQYNKNAFETQEFYKKSVLPFTLNRFSYYYLEEKKIVCNKNLLFYL